MIRLIFIVVITKKTQMNTAKIRIAINFTIFLNKNTTGTNNNRLNQKMGKCLRSEHFYNHRGRSWATLKTK